MATTRKALSVSERLGAAAYLAFTGKSVAGNKIARAAAAEGAGRVPKSMRTKAGIDDSVNDPYRDQTLDEVGPGRPTGKPGRVFNRWTYPFRGYSMPILEIPSNRVVRYTKCFEYFTSDDIVNSALNMKISFALANHEIHVTIDSDEVPLWMPLDEIPDQSLVPEASRTPLRVFIGQHIKQKLEDLKEKLDVDRWNQNFWLEAAIYGDAFANIVDGIERGPQKQFQQTQQLQSLASAVLAGDKSKQTLAAYTKLLREKTSWTEEQTVFAEIEKVKAEMAEIEKTYAGVYKNAYKEGKLLQDASSKADKKKPSDIYEVSAGAVQIHVGPHLLEKAEKFAETFDGTAETAFAKLNELAKKRDDLIRSSALGGAYTIDVIQTLNPSAVWETRNDVGQVVRMELVKRIGVDATPMVIGDQIHCRWSGSDYTTYGISDIFPAFRAIKLKRSLEEALAAYGERYSQPIIQVAVGSDDPQSQMNAALDILLEDARDLFASYDRRSVLVTPWHYKINIIGTDGKPLRLDMYLTYATERMLTALGVPKTFLWGDGANFATARTQYQSLINRLKSLQEKSNRMMSSRIYGRYLDRRGYLDGAGNKIKVSCTFENNDMDSEETVAALLTAMAAVAKSTGNPTLLLSDTTLTEMLGQDIDIEQNNKMREAAKLMRLKGIMTEQAPSQDPAKAAPLIGQVPVSPQENINTVSAEISEALLSLAQGLDAEIDTKKKIVRAGGLEEISIEEAMARIELAKAKKKIFAKVEDHELMVPAGAK